MPTSAIVAAWELGLRLRERRDHLGLSVGAAAKAVKMQQPNLSAVETGKKKITTANLDKLAKLYEFEPDEHYELEALRVRADQRDWYHQYTWMLDDDFFRFVGLESGAVQLRTYQSSIVPGPMQTVDYAEAVIKGGKEWVRGTEVEPRMEVRQARQQRLSDDEPLRVSAVLSEAVLRQEVGGREVLRDQLEHLEQLSNRDNIEVRVIPFAAGAHAALGASFQILSFPSSRLPDIVYLEALTRFTIIDRKLQVREFMSVFNESSRYALDDQASIDLIRQIREELTP